MNKAFVINLNDRQQEFKRVERAFRPYGISCERFLAKEHPQGAIGCALSHLEIIAHAKEHDWPWVMVFEDDCIPREPMQEWPLISTFLIEKQAQWDLFLGGCMSPLPLNFQHIRSTTIDMVECLLALALHFVIYNKSSYDRILAWHDLPEVMEERADIDAFIQDCSLKIWVPSPFVAWQKPGLSNTTKKFGDYSAYFRGSEFTLDAFKVSTNVNLKH